MIGAITAADVVLETQRLPDLKRRRRGFAHPSVKCKMPVAVAHQATDRPSTRGSHGKSVLPAARCHQALLGQLLSTYRSIRAHLNLPGGPTITYRNGHPPAERSSVKFILLSSAVLIVTPPFTSGPGPGLYSTYSVRHRYMVLGTRC
jgi:hypothetical protein